MISMLLSADMLRGDSYIFSERNVTRASAAAYSRQEAIAAARLPLSSACS